jgi:hypothetical protein
MHSSAVCGTETRYRCIGGDDLLVDFAAVFANAATPMSRTQTVSVRPVKRFMSPSGGGEPRQNATPGAR